jgi:hypothetical protein
VSIQKLLKSSKRSTLKETRAPLPCCAKKGSVVWHIYHLVPNKCGNHHHNFLGSSLPSQFLLPSLASQISMERRKQPLGEAVTMSSPRSDPLFSPSLNDIRAELPTVDDGKGFI